MKHRYHQAVTLLLLLMLLLQMASSSSAETLTKLGNSALRKAIKDSVYADWHIYQPTDMEISGKYSLQGTTQGRYLTGGVPPVRFSM